MSDWYTVTVVNPHTHRELTSRKKRIRLDVDDIMHSGRLTIALRKHGVLHKQERVLSAQIGPKLGHLRVSIEGAI